MVSMKIWLVAIAIGFSGGIGAAAEFSIVQWHGGEVIQLKGEITAGDADRFKEIVTRVRPYPHGVPVMLLESVGGSVDAAMELSDAMDEFPVHTIVANNTECSSACASIVFVAGEYRTMQTYGRFGQHSCSRGGIPVPECNERIAQHAFEHGVSHGSIAAFVTYVPPEDILWFSKWDLDGWGISRYPGSEAVAFQKSEPRAIEMITGRVPAAQDVWRLDFWGNGWRAFYRPYRDDDRELQISQFCVEDSPGRLYVGMEIHGEVEEIRAAIEEVTVSTEAFTVRTSNPATFQLDSMVSVVIVELQEQHVIPWLTKAKSFRFHIKTKAPYDPIIVWGSLAGSRSNLIFAANHCTIW